MERRQFLSGFRTTSLATLASRVLGLVRDIATAALFGLSGDGVMDAFVVAFRVPNLFRRLFGEGALAASYLPVFVREYERDPRSAWQLASVLLTWLSIVLLAVVVLAEGLLAGAYWLWSDRPGVPLLLGLTATMLPYLVLICLTAQLAATLQGLSHFALPALAPVALNVCWLMAVWWIAPAVTSDKQGQAFVLAAAVLVAGFVQVGMQLPPLAARGFRFDYDPSGSGAAVREIAGSVGPVVLGLAVTQLNTLADVLLAWGLSASPETGETISWLGGISYPMSQGAAATVYYGERLYQFPLGILGVAIATAIFPLLSRHAARRDEIRLGADLTLGLRLALLLALPASVGLVILGQPLAALLFERGEFTADDAQRTGRMIACYGTGVWAYCAVTVLVRGYYAVGDRRTPIRVALLMVGCNLLMNLLLVWPLAEAGLAVSTAVSASLQAVLLAAMFTRRQTRLDWTALARSAAAAGMASAGMGLACYATLRWMPISGGAGGRMAGVIGPLAASLVVYFGLLRLIRPSELRIWTRDRDLENHIR